MEISKLIENKIDKHDLEIKRNFNNEILKKVFGKDYNSLPPEYIYLIKNYGGMAFKNWVNFIYENGEKEEVLITILHTDNTIAYDNIETYYNNTKELLPKFLYPIFSIEGGVSGDVYIEFKNHVIEYGFISWDKNGKKIILGNSLIDLLNIF